MDEPVASDPNKAGVATSEYKLAKAITIAGAVLVGLMAGFTQLKHDMPDAAWVASALSILGVLGTVLTVANRYVGGRAQVKVAQLQVEAAQLHADAAVAVAKADPSKPSGG